MSAENPAWDPRYHGSIMMAPVLFCACLMAIVAGSFALFVALRLWQYRVAKRPFRAHNTEPHDEEEVVMPPMLTVPHMLDAMHAGCSTVTRLLKGRQDVCRRFCVHGKPKRCCGCTVQGAWVLQQKGKEAEMATRATPNGIHALHARD